MARAPRARCHPEQAGRLGRGRGRGVRGSHCERRRQATARRESRGDASHRRHRTRRDGALSRHARRGGPDGPLARVRRALGVHDVRTDWRRRRHQCLQPSAQPDRAPGGAGHRRGLPRHREARGDHSALLPALRRPGAAGGTARRLVPGHRVRQRHCGEPGHRSVGTRRRARRCASAAASCAS